MSIHFFGIRHHGPGSARRLRQALEELQPDLLLVEGPAEADSLLPHFPLLEPPVAILGYQSDDTQQASLFPFAVFSPEWQAMDYAHTNQLPLRFFDLPLAHAMPLSAEESPQESTTEDVAGCSAAIAEPSPAADLTVWGDKPLAPTDHLARLAGMDEGESWWDLQIERCGEGPELFPAVHEAMQALREAFPQPESRLEACREAWMRKCIRQAEKEGFTRIAVICGAWHVSALANMPKAAEDNRTLKQLPKVGICCTWIPWTYSRLSLWSGYGAGMPAPGWYHHLWMHPEDSNNAVWMAKATQMLRQQGMDMSAAHAVEAVRLAEALALMRGYHKAGLPELEEAMVSVMGMGNEQLLTYLRPLLTGDLVGSVPASLTHVPLLSDAMGQWKSLRIPIKEQPTVLSLDLRDARGLEKSIFLHRLRLLDVPVTLNGDQNKLGTFQERWEITYTPDISLCLIEKAAWGATLQAAATAFMREQVKQHITTLPPLVELLRICLPADLPELTDILCRHIGECSAHTYDVVSMLQAVPDLAAVMRYGDVRGLDYTHIGAVIETLMGRIQAGGAAACRHIDQEQAQELFKLLMLVQQALSLLNTPLLTEYWDSLLLQLQEQQDTHPLLSGYATRLHFDKGLLSETQTALRLSFHTGSPAEQAGYWLEGFLQQGALTLLMNTLLWTLVDQWITSLSEERFVAMLPLLRRISHSFGPTECRQLGQKALQGPMHAQQLPSNTHYTDIPMPLLWQLLE